MKTETWKRSGILLLTAFIWGIAFVAQSVGMDYVEPFTFNGVRTLLGGIVLIPCIFILKKINPPAKKEEKADKKMLIMGGTLCGIALCVGSSLQQIGLAMYSADTNVGKAGFITALYIILVPLIGIFMKKKAGLTVWLGVLLAVFGFYFLCIKDGFSVELADIIVLIGSVAFSFHILIIDYFADKADGVKLSCIQFFTCGAICLLIMLLLENPTWEAIWAARIPILYAGVMSCGVAYTLQIIGQKNMNPTVASLLLSLESVFSALAGWVILNQSLNMRELFGCVLVFAAIILAQMPQKKR
ncbi:MAG: DMT family transporter [Lachnospiraceae bacterium]|nr:DMT family transporter [Lachnospiraceae bacterium]